MIHLRPTIGLGRHTVESRAPKVLAADDALTQLYRNLDFFPTPPWAARAICERVKMLDPEARTMKEPACGQGHFAEPAREYFADVDASDVHDYGYGAVQDYLFMPQAADELVDWTCTNPPFQLAQEFAHLGMRNSRRGVALLVRLAFLATEGRYELIHGGQHAEMAIVFSERVAMQLGSWDPDGSTQTEYCCVIWRRDAVYGHPPILRGFPPGTKARLTRPEDAARFGVPPAPPAPMPLFLES